MASDIQGKAIVIMGVSGAGKSITSFGLRDCKLFKELFLVRKPHTFNNINNTAGLFMTLLTDCWKKEDIKLNTIGELLAKALDCSFLDADDFHPQSNKDKMHQGIPLTEEDRIPWLEILQDALRESLISGKTVVLSCSALQKRYREILRSADCNYHHDGSFKSAVKFVLLDAKAEVLAERLDKRAAEGKHFMPAKLLQSQLELLQIDDSEAVCKVDATLNPQELVNSIKTLIFEPGKPIAL